MNNMTCNETGGALIGAAKLAEMIGVETRTIHNWTDEGFIPVAIRVGRTVRFNLEDVKKSLDELTERNRQARMKTPAPLDAQVSEAASTPLDAQAPPTALGSQVGLPWNHIEIGPYDDMKDATYNQYTERWEVPRKCYPAPVDPDDLPTHEFEDAAEQAEWEQEAFFEHASKPVTDSPWN